LLLRPGDSIAVPPNIAWFSPGRKSNAKCWIAASELPWGRSHEVFRVLLYGRYIGQPRFFSI